MDNYSDHFEYGGDDPFECQYCSGMGYMDYPSNQKPCPIHGHKERYENNLRDVMAMMDGQRKEYTAKMGDCPYCYPENQGQSCKHWTGLGWTRDAEKNRYRNMIFR